ncbi:helix-turn-helix domain-containing protein [Robinsoniella peoriensis]|uniref:helix-turn-helix domain-containing protein n=1 Tax=Robinsoniella peoriensis TaxID=180332 RepID=UPI003642AF49
MNVFSERLKQLRSERQILQKDIAKYLEVTVRTYQYYESGELEPDLEKLVKLADLFNVSTDYLLGRRTGK